MNTIIKQIDDDLAIVYSSLHDCYYLKNLISQLVSSKSYRTAEEALDYIENNKVMWIEDVKG
jgi:hypothetical protein